MPGAKPPPTRPPYSPDSTQNYAEPFPRLSSESRDFAPGMNGTMHSEKWLPGRNNRTGFTRSGIFNLGARHGRQKSLTEAINTIRTRKASMSQNAHEIADALKAPISPKLVVRPSLLPRCSQIVLIVNLAHVFCMVYHFHGRQYFSR